MRATRTSIYCCIFCSQPPLTPASPHPAGEVPGLVEGNAREPLMPWSDPHNGRVVLGATVEEACAGPGQLKEALGRFAGAGCCRVFGGESLEIDRGTMLLHAGLDAGDGEKCKA